MLMVGWKLSRNWGLLHLFGSFYGADQLPHSMVSGLQGQGCMHEELEEREREIESCIIFYDLDSEATQCLCNNNNYQKQVTSNLNDWLIIKRKGIRLHLLVVRVACQAFTDKFETTTYILTSRPISITFCTMG